MFKNKFNYISFLIFFFLFGQKINSQLSTLDKELSSNYVNLSIIDNYGLIWISTQEGLNMYDGKKIHVFESILADDTTPINTNIENIIQLPNDNLVFISKDGLSVFNRDSFNFLRVKIPSPVSFLLDEINERIYLTTSINGIFVLDTDFKVLSNFKTETLNPFSLSSNSFDKNNRQRKIKVLNNKGDVIIGTSQGLNIYSNKKNNFLRYLDNSASSNDINVISSIDNNIVLYGTKSNLEIFNFEDKTFKKIDYYENMIILDIFTPSIENQSFFDGDELMSTSSNQNVFFSSFILTNKGLYKASFDSKNNHLNSVKIFENKSNKFDRISKGFSRFYLWGRKEKELYSLDFEGENISKIVSPYSLNNLCVNQSDDLYLSTINGVFTTSEYQMFLKPTNLFSESDTDTNNIIFYNWIDKNTSILIDKKNINVKRNNSIQVESLKKYFNNELIQSLTDKKIYYMDNSLFFLGLNSLFRITLDKMRLTNYDLPGDIVFNKIKILNSSVYLSFSNGILNLDLSSRKIKKVEFDELFNKDFPRGFSDIIHVKDELWVSNSESGLHVFENKQIDNKPSIRSSDNVQKNMIPSYSINNMVYDDKKEIALISTQGDGLFIFSKKDSLFNQFTIKDGLLSNNILDAEIGDNYIWTLSNRGVNYFDIDDKFFFEIDKLDGLDVLSYNSDPLRINYSKMELDEEDYGELDFNQSDFFEQFIEIVGFNKIYNFKRNDLLVDDDPFNINTLNIRAFDSTQDFFSISSSEDLLEIDSQIDFIEIELFSNNKFKRDQVKYFYQISGVTDGFISNGLDNILRLQSIPNYKSELQIKAVNKSGVDSSNVLTYTLSKTPPWYRRTETIILYIIFLLTSILLFIKWREKSTSKKLEDERRNQELEEARKLQNSLLPKKIPSRKEYDISVYLKSATEVGGDYYDFIENENNELYAICGDATGHGVVSGIMVSVTKAGLNGINMDDPSTILNNLNSIVKRVNFGRLRMSLSVAKINNGSIELSSAAMPPTYYYNAKKNNVEEILVPNLPLGGIEGEKFDGVKKDFKKGDVIVMISDGLPELPNKEDVLLDYPKVFECIKNNCNESADEIKDALVSMSENWADGLMNPDDITIVVIKKAS
tara:strand:- start:74 stop:3421 length:3348 start_codon:yes stop_codon:yes gene_type:complete